MFLICCGPYSLTSCVFNDCAMICSWLWMICAKLFFLIVAPFYLFTVFFFYIWEFYIWRRAATKIPVPRNCILEKKGGLKPPPNNNFRNIVKQWFLHAGMAAEWCGDQFAPSLSSGRWKNDVFLIFLGFVKRM